MRKIALLGAIIAANFAVAATAADDPIGGVYGNTVVITIGTGETTKLWINTDHTFTGESSKGRKFSGKWVLKENNTKFCTTPDLPANAPKDTPAPKELCATFEAGHKVGDKWEQTQANGEKKIIEIKTGM
ncbi:MAG: hypothetical protein HY243_00345 [Proteobacteria bacterium]|nr:hypothetical protein [Pseudomonadota bacterium]